MQRFQEEVSEDLRDVKADIDDIKERLLVAKDVLQRIEIRAPITGVVQALKIHTLGGVVRPGDILMEIVPKDDDLLVQATVSPTDVDDVKVGQNAEVRLTALNARLTPTIYGNVKSISGDALFDEATGLPYFTTIIEIPKYEREKLGGIKLSAGMPAEVLINAGERTALNYIVKPILDALSRGLNEE